VQFWERIKSFKPPLLLSCVGALLFSAASLVAVGTDFGEKLPAIITYILYVCAAITLTLAVWALVIFFQKHNLKDALHGIAHREKLTARLWDDYGYRTVVFGYCSLVLNIVFAVSKAVAGWYFSSVWLMVLAGYYLLLCITKSLLLRSGRKASRIHDEKQRALHEWKAYRLCGILLALLTVTLQGIVIMIIENGSTFSYQGYLIFVVAMYDFYCLISSIVYMAKTRKKHSPSVVAIKYISFATSLVAILSLQTAMFASFANQKMEAEKQQLMNTVTGSAVCLLLIILGVVMIVQAGRQIKKLHS